MSFCGLFFILVVGYCGLFFCSRACDRCGPLGVVFLLGFFARDRWCLPCLVPPLLSFLPKPQACNASTSFAVFSLPRPATSRVVDLHLLPPDLVVSQPSSSRSLSLLPPVACGQVDSSVFVSLSLRTSRVPDGSAFMQLCK